MAYDFAARPLTARGYIADPRRGKVSGKTNDISTEQALRRRVSELEGLLLQCERDRNEINHRVANSLQLTSSFLKLQRGRVSDEAAVEALDIAAARVGAVAHLHRHLYTHGIRDRVDIAAFLRELCPEISASIGVKCSVEAEPMELPGTAATQLAIAVNELALNALKHAYDGQEGSAVTIRSRRDGDGLLCVTVADGGKGLPDGFSPDRSTGLGMRIVQSIVSQLGGELRAETNGGAHFTMAIPLKEANRP